VEFGKLNLRHVKLPAEDYDIHSSFFIGDHRFVFEFLSKEIIVSISRFFLSETSGKCISLTNFA